MFNIILVNLFEVVYFGLKSYLVFYFFKRLIDYYFSKRAK